MNPAERLLHPYIDSWRGQPQSRVQAEIASVLAEAAQEPDIYSFRVDPSFGFIDPLSNKPVRNFLDKETPLGRAEMDAFDTLETWAKTSKTGIGVWISPPHEKRSPDIKVIITLPYQENGTQFARNTALIIPGDEIDAIQIANDFLSQIGSYRMPFVNSEVLRKSALTYNKETSQEIVLKAIKDAVGNCRAIKEMQSDEARKKAKERDQYARDYYNMTFKGVPRNIYPSSYSNIYESYSSPTCPPVFMGLPTASEYFLGFGAYKFVRNCGGKKENGDPCKKEIMKFICKGYKCEACGGIYEGC